MVLSRIAHKGERYLLLSGYEDFEVVFVRIESEDVVEPLEDGALLLELVEKVRKDIENQKVLEMINNQ